MWNPGSDEIRKLFLNDFTNSGVRINHGSYGLAPDVVMKKRFELLNEQEQQPDVWFRVSLTKYYSEAVKAAADFIDADAEDTFIVDNTTTGINCVLKSLKFSPDAEILLTTHTYRAVQNTAKDVERANGFKRSYLQLKFPISSEEEVVQLYEKTFSENENIKIAVIDHITGPSAVKLPVKKLVGLCRKYNVISVVDGAHAPGQLKLSMKDIGADFYSGNFHKWMYVSRSCAFLYVSPPFRDQIHHVISSDHVKTPHDRFGYIGTRDYSPFFTLPTAIKFYQDMGGLETITSYVDKLITWAQEMLCESLGLQPLGIPRSMRATTMGVVSLPPWPKDQESVDRTQRSIVFWKKYSVQVAFTYFNDEIWLRFSANIYNTKDDYLKLRDALIDFYKLNL